jgi:hypothetical protein
MSRHTIALLRYFCDRCGRSETAPEDRMPPGWSVRPVEGDLARDICEGCTTGQPVPPVPGERHIVTRVGGGR